MILKKVGLGKIVIANVFTIKNFFERIKKNTIFFVD